MDDHMRGWMWSHSGDNKYYDALPMEQTDADTGEPYVDSLSQLNKIVERILPDKSPLSLMSVRPKLEIPSSLKRSFVDHKDCNREFQSRKASSLSSSATEILMDSPVKHPPLSVMPSVGLQDSLRLKALRASDSLNDSAYETYCGDVSNDALDSMDRTARTDDLSSANDPADYCVSPSGRKSEDDSKPLHYTEEEEAGMISHSLIKDSGGDLAISSNVAGDSDNEQARSPSVEAEREPDKRGEPSGAFLTESESNQSSLRVNERRLSNKCQNGSYRYNMLASSGLSGADKLPELGRYVGDNKWTGTNLCTEVSTSVHAAESESTFSGSDSKLQASLMIDSSRLLGGRVGRVQDGRNAGTGDEEVKSFTCPHCAYSASKKGQVRKHLSVHGIFLCAHCEFACDRADLLEEHRRMRHPGLCGRRLCKKCRVLFQSSELEAHELKCSGEKQRWACHTCGKEFKFLSVMKAHAHKWHPPVDDGISAKPVDTASDTASSKPCSVSSGTASVTLNPTQPEAVVARELKQFQCSECGKVFKTKWTLSNHALSHAGADTPFCCDVDSCSGVTFRSDKELNCHRMAVHRLGPTKYECSQPGCTMHFAKYGHFKRHQLTHAAAAESELSSTDASERQFVCDWAQCGKAFSHPDNLRVHYRRHTDEKPHRCHHCEAAYRQKSGLKYHLEKVHGEKTVGRCGRKRKLALENNSILSSAASNQIPCSDAFMPSRTGQLCSPKAERSGQTVLLEPDTVDSIKHTALSKVREINIVVSDLQTKQRTKSDADSTAEGLRWSLPESLSQDCDDNLENIDINDEWLLNEEDGFISNHRKLPDTGGTADEGEREQAGSTSDTEPLDEDLCEELRKLSDAINGEALSPRGLDSMSPFDSPVGAAYGASKSDRIGNVLPDMSSPHAGLFRGVCNREEQPAVFDQFSSASLPRDSNVTSDFYPRHPDTGAAVVNKSGMLSQDDSGTSKQTEIINGYVPDGYSCPDVHPAHFDGNTPTSESTHLPVDVAEIVEPAPCHSSPFEDPVHPWPLPVNSSRWSSNSRNSAFLSAHRISSVSAHLSAETGFSSETCRDDGTYSTIMSSWLPTENSQHWLSHDDISPGWSQRQLATVSGNVSRRLDWQMGHHRESPFSRCGTAFDGRLGFESGRQTSPKLFLPYRPEIGEVPPMSDHFVDSLTGKHNAVYPASGISPMGAWSDLHSRSSHMAGIGNYDCLPRNVYQSPVQSDHFHLTSGYSGIQSHTSYERGVETEGSYGISNGAYQIPPVHAPSWPVSGLTNAGESLRPTPDGHQSSMLYNVVPRYY